MGRGAPSCLRVAVALMLRSGRRILLAATALRRGKGRFRRAGVAVIPTMMGGMVRMAVIPVRARVWINRPAVVRTRVIRRWWWADADADTAPEIPPQIGLRVGRCERDRQRAECCGGRKRGEFPEAP